MGSREKQKARSAPWPVADGRLNQTEKAIMVVSGLVVGYLIGFFLMEAADHVYRGHHQLLDQQIAVKQEPTQAVLTKPDTLGSQKQSHTIHSLVTSNGSPYQNLQARIMYGTYKLVQKMPGGEYLTGFTRILHRMQDDLLMDEIPTFRATPLHPACDVWCDFPVADRPNAVAQWVAAVKAEPSLLKGAWVLMIECDYVWMRPLQAPDARDTSVQGWQFFFDYIIPNHRDCRHIIQRLAGPGVSPARVTQSGPAPALLRFETLEKVVPAWEKVTAAIEADAEAVKVLDWVREMYAWVIALAQSGVELDTRAPPHSPLIAQPPHEAELFDAAMFHYTWGSIYNDSTHEVWRFEKRDYTSAEAALHVPHLAMPPEPFCEGCWHLQDHAPVTQHLHDTLRAMVGQMNAAIATLPDLSAAAAGARSGRRAGLRRLARAAG